MIGKGGAITAVGLYQHKTAAAFIGIKGKAKLDGPQSLRKLKIGSTPGGSDALHLRIFTAANGMKTRELPGGTGPAKCFTCQSRMRMRATTSAPAIGSLLIA
jgi:hypothetical protein